MQAGAGFFSCFGALRLSADFLREQCVILSGEGYDTIGNLIEMTLDELFAWIGARNKVKRDQHGK